MFIKGKYNKLSKSELDKCRKIFDKIDKNNSGGIDMNEMLDGIKSYSKAINSSNEEDIKFIMDILLPSINFPIIIIELKL